MAATGADGGVEEAAMNVEQTIKELHQQLIGRSPKSYQAWQNNLKFLPDGVGSRWGYTQPFPIVAARTQGARLWDEDGVEFIDCQMSQETLILGNSPEFLVKTLRSAIDQGLGFGVVNRNEGVLAAMIGEHYPSVEKLAFTTTGTEANHCALRLARAYTGRNMVAKFEGGFHGCVEFLQGSIMHHPQGPNGEPNPIEDPVMFPESAGLLPEAIQNTLVLPFNHKAAFDKIRRNADRLAAVIIEPMQGPTCCPADAEFMRELREVTRECGVLLILDEVITGFKMALGGGQAVYGIKPDLTTFGKTLSGGLPLSAVGGRADILNHLSLEAGAGTVIYGGTHAAHPIMLATAVESLAYLAKHPEIYTRLDAYHNRIRDELNDFCREHDMAATVNGRGFMTKVHLVDGEYRGIRDMARENPQARQVFLLLQRLHGLHTALNGLCILCAETTDADVDRIIDIHKQALLGLRNNGLI
jgi:glutamate-1-semialdehyde 2,1-aminomutase